MGYVPIDRPRFAIVVMIDEPKGNPYGGVVAAPVFREVGKWSLNKMGVNPLVMTVERSDEQKSGGEENKTGRVKMGSIQIRDETLPDFKGLGMREVLKIGKSLGLKVSLEGTGLAYEQEPAAGASIEKVSILKVIFRPPS